LASKGDVSLKIRSNVDRVKSANVDEVSPDSHSPTTGRNPIHGMEGSGNLVGEVALGDDVDYGYRLGVASMDNDKGRDEGIKSPQIQIKSHLFNEDERSGNSPVASSFSQTRTRTACFSHNRYSEEIIKTTNQFGVFNGSGGIKETPLNDGIISRMSCLKNGQTIAGSHVKLGNMEALEIDEVQSKQVENNLIHPPGFEPRLSFSCVNSEENSIPPRFEGMNRLKVSPVRGRRNVKKHTVAMEKRVTRSQSKSFKVPGARSKRTLKKGGHGLGGKEESPYDNESAETTESMRNIAEEALEIGEMLGLKVVANRGAAVKRITESLKNARISKSTHKTD